MKIYTSSLSADHFLKEGLTWSRMECHIEGH